MLCKAIKYFDKTIRIGCLEFRLAKRNGNAFCCWRDCIHSFINSSPRHMRGYYIQIGKWGGHIMWDSDICYEEYGQDI